MTAPEAAAGNRRALIMALGGVGLLLVVFLGSRLLGGGGDDEPAAPPPASPGVTAAPTTTTTLPGPADLETFEVFTTKNPFIPLSGAGSGGGAGGGTGSGGGTGGGTGTGGGGTGGGSTGGGGTGGGSGGSSGSGGSGTGSGSSAEPSRSERVSLLEIFVEGGRTVANVRVNDTVYKVGEGDAFASRYRVVSLSQAEGCGRFLFGDDQFRLCRGEQVLK